MLCTAMQSSTLNDAIEAGQQGLDLAARSEAAAIEQAFGRYGAAFTEALAARVPSSGAKALAIGSGYACYTGRGNPMTQATGLGFAGEVTRHHLDALENHLGWPAQVEVSAFADASLTAGLAERGYAIAEWHQLWVRPADLAVARPPTDVRVEPMKLGQEALFTQTMMAGFLGSGAVGDEMLQLLSPVPYTANTFCFLAWLGGQAIGAATLVVDGEIGLLTGASTLQAHRRRGTQAALLHARQDFALANGCTILTCVTRPGTASHRNMQRMGFHAAYPRVVMVRAST